MKKVEHLVINIGDLDPLQREMTVPEFLNHMGRQGWHFAAMVDQTLVFWRELDGRSKTARAAK